MEFLDEDNSEEIYKFALFHNLIILKNVSEKFLKEHLRNVTLTEDIEGAALFLRHKINEKFKKERDDDDSEEE
jgi:hypothetical protein